MTNEFEQMTNTELYKYFLFVIENKNMDPFAVSEALRRCMNHLIEHELLYYND